MADIRSKDLLEKFVYALENKWGYIWGTAGSKWTQEKQNAATRDMTVKYGQRWVGHYVADCSGLFYWAFKSLGGYMYHGSNTMYKSYCVNKGKLAAGKREDGQELKPGTAIFTGSENDHGHVGLYVGGGEIIEAKGTINGVIKSKITEKNKDGSPRWTYWGEMKGVIYEGGDQPMPEPEPAPQPEKGTAIVTGKNLALREGPSTSAKVLTRMPTGTKVKITEVPKDWQYVQYEGKTGFVMRKYIQEG